MNWNEAAPSAIAGAVAATIGVVLLELWLKPAFARKRVAQIMLAEVRLNARGVRHVMKHRETNPETIPWDVELSTRGWDAVASELHHLPLDAIAKLLELYGNIGEINNYAKENSRQVDLMLQMPPGAPALAAIDQGTAHMSRVFGEALQSTAGRCEKVIAILERLVELGPPDWSEQSSASA